MTDEADTVGQPVADTPRGDEHVGFGRVGAVVASVPDRVALLVLCGSLVVTAMLQFKVFNPYAAVVATVVAFAGTWRILPTRDNPTDQRSVLGVVVAVEVVAAWVWVNAPYYAQELSVYRDPAIYALRGWWLTQHSSPVIGMSVAMTGAAGVPGATVAAAGFPVHGAVAYPQASSLVPGLLAVAGRLGGLRVMLAANLIIAAAALLLVYGVARRMMGPIWALLPLVALGLSMPMVYFARASYTEPLALAAVFGGLLLVFRAFDSGRLSLFFLAGLTVGVSALARIDGVLAVVGTMVGIGIAAAAATKSESRVFLRRAVISFAAGGLVCSIAGWFDLSHNSPVYYHTQAADLRALFTLFAVLFVVVIVASYLPLRRVRVYGAQHRVGLAQCGVGFVLSVCVVMASRPLWWVGRFNTTPVVQAAVAQRQKAAGLTIDPTRSYDEHTVAWLAWYLSWPVVITAAAGLAIIAWRVVRFRERGPLAFLATFGIVAALYMNDVNITPDQIWASRRLLPVVIPAVLIAAGLAAATLYRSQRWRGLAVPLAVLIALGPALQWRYLFMQPEFAGELAAVNSACAAIDRNSGVAPQRHVVLAGPVPATGPWSPTLQIICNSTVVAIPHATPAALTQIRTNWADEPITVITFDPASLTWTAPTTPTPHFTGVAAIWNQSLVTRPAGTTPVPVTFWAGTVEPDGRVKTLAP